MSDDRDRDDDGTPLLPVARLWPALGWAVLLWLGILLGLLAVIGCALALGEGSSARISTERESAVAVEIGASRVKR